MPMTSNPRALAVRTTARKQAFIPGASPPLVRTPIRFIPTPGVEVKKKAEDNLSFFQCFRQVKKII
jgi:hypothetical protein